MRTAPEEDAKLDLLQGRLCVESEDLNTARVAYERVLGRRVARSTVLEAEIGLARIDVRGDAGRAAARLTELAGNEGPAAPRAELLGEAADATARSGRLGDALGILERAAELGPRGEREADTRRAGLFGDLVRTLREAEDWSGLVTLYAAHTTTVRQVLTAKDRAVIADALARLGLPSEAARLLALDATSRDAGARITYAESALKAGALAEARGAVARFEPRGMGSALGPRLARVQARIALADGNLDSAAGLASSAPDAALDAEIAAAFVTAGDAAVVASDWDTATARYGRVLDGPAPVRARAGAAAGLGAHRVRRAATARRRASRWPPPPRAAIRSCVARPPRWSASPCRRIRCGGRARDPGRAGHAGGPTPAEMLALNTALTTPPPELGGLARAFAHFTDATARLEHEYGALRIHVHDLTAELEEKNRLLAESLERERRLEAEALRQSRLAAMGEMAAMLAHEVRNPLGAMELFTGLLLQDLADQPDAVRLARQVASGIADLNHLVTNLLEFTRTRVASRSIVDCCALVEDALRYTGELRAAGAIVVERAYAAPVVAAEADPHLLRRHARGGRRSDGAEGVAAAAQSRRARTAAHRRAPRTPRGTPRQARHGAAGGDRRPRRPEPPRRAGSSRLIDAPP